VNSIHNRVHPFFSDAFLTALGSLPCDHPLNQPHLLTRVEIVIAKDGHIRRMGVARGSGVALFDVAALEAIDRAQPFPPVPSEIVSWDGAVHIGWEFHRDEVFACSTAGVAFFTPPVPSTPNPGESAF